MICFVSPQNVCRLFSMLVIKLSTGNSHKAYHLRMQRPWSVEPRLHERFFSENCCVASTQWWLHEWQSLWFCCKNLNSLNFSQFLFLRFFSCCHHSTCTRVATRVIFTTHWQRANLNKKLHHHRKQNITRVAVALRLATH